MSILRQSAKGQECMMRIPGICSHNPETTVLAHENGGGLALKHDDLRATFACSACHSYYDNKSSDEIAPKVLMENYFYKGHMRTLQWWIDNDYIVIQQPKVTKISKYMPRKY